MTETSIRGLKTRAIEVPVLEEWEARNLCGISLMLRKAFFRQGSMLQASDADGRKRTWYVTYGSCALLLAARRLRVCPWTRYCPIFTWVPAYLSVASRVDGWLSSVQL